MTSVTEPRAAADTGVPHGASLAVWDVPMPAVTGERFTVKIGVKSAAGSVLAGATVEILDARGAVVASGQLGAERWPGTEALYWAALEVPAPATTGVSEYLARFVPGAVVPPHQAAATSFSVAAMPRPEHRITVTVTENGSAKPLEGVEIRVGPFRARTDGAGQAELHVCGGRYQLHAWRWAYEAPARSIEIDRDTSLALTMQHVPEEHPDARWVK